jgi:hypothetical protein
MKKRALFFKGPYSVSLVAKGTQLERDAMVMLYSHPYFLITPTTNVDCITNGQDGKWENRKIFRRNQFSVFLVKG